MIWTKTRGAVGIVDGLGVSNNFTSSYCVGHSCTDYHCQCIFWTPRVVPLVPRCSMVSSMAHVLDHSSLCGQVICKAKLWLN